jgi:Tfp pilus assembly protein PilF
MTKHPISLAVALAFAASSMLSGCDRGSRLTEQEHIQRAKDYEDKGNLRVGIIELKNAIQKNPESQQARLMLGQLYLKVGMGAEAEKELRQAEKLGP